MKRYKLLKDLPTFKAGDEFYIDSNNDLRLKGRYIIAYNHYTLEKFPNILKDWFEEIPEEPKRWRREEEHGTYLKYLIAREILLDDAEGGKFFNTSDNWGAYYSDWSHAWNCERIFVYCPGIIYFKTQKALQKSLKEHKEQWRIVRKYEMGEM